MPRPRTGRLESAKTSPAGAGVGVTVTDPETLADAWLAPVVVNVNEYTWVIVNGIAPGILPLVAGSGLYTSPCDPLLITDALAFCSGVELPGGVMLVEKTFPALASTNPWLVELTVAVPEPMLPAEPPAEVDTTSKGLVGATHPSSLMTTVIVCVPPLEPKLVRILLLLVVLIRDPSGLPDQLVSEVMETLNKLTVALLTSKSLALLPASRETPWLTPSTYTVIPKAARAWVGATSRVPPTKATTAKGSRLFTRIME